MENHRFAQDEPLREHVIIRRSVGVNQFKRFILTKLGHTAEVLE